MKLLYFSLIFFCICLVVNSNGQTLSGVTKKDYQFGSNTNLIRTEYSSNSGYFYMAGNIDTPPASGGGTTGNARSFISKYDSLGIEQWSIMENALAQGLVGFTINSIALDANDNIYFTGFYKGSLTFGNVTMPSVPTSGGAYLIGKVNSSGQVLWMYGGATTTGNTWSGLDIKTDNSGNVYVLGTLKNTVTLGSYTFTAPSLQSKNFIAKYDNTGTLLSAFELGQYVATTGSGFNRITLGNTTNPSIYLSGYFSGSLTFGSTTISSNNNSTDVMIAKLNNAGSIMNVISYGGTGTEYQPKIVKTNTNNFIISGEYFGTLVAFGNNYSVNNNSSADAYILKADTNLNMQWLQTYGCTAMDYIWDITTDQYNNIYVAGEMRSTLTIGQYTLPYTISGTGSNGCFLKFSPSGNLLYADNTTAITTGTSYISFERGKGVKTTNSGNKIFYVGEFEGNMQLGTTSLSSNVVNRLNLYIANYQNSAPLGIEDIDLFGNLNEERALIKWNNHNVRLEYFEIERSLDGANFEKIGKVNVVENVNQYAFEDDYPRDQKQFYYRLHCFSLNENYYSKVIELKGITNNATLVVFPNPSLVHTPIYINSTVGVNEIQLYNILGNLMTNFNHFEKSNDYLTIKEPGIYLLKIIRQTDVQYRRITVY